MEPDFKAGDVIIVDPEVEPTPESLLWPRTVGLKRPLKNIGLLTRITWAASISSFVPLNDDYPIISSDHQPLTIIGVMIEHRIYRRKR